MTERDISGNAARSKFRAAQKLAEDFGISDEALEFIAQGVREFDAERSASARQARALEKIASKVGPEKDSAAYENGRLRRREVYATELLALSVVATDEELERVRASNAYKRLLARMAGVDEPGT